MNNIYFMRTRSKLTQNAVARKINLDRSTVAKWESGRSNPRAETLILLAELFNCSIDELLIQKQENITGNCEL